ncbi:MAG TPA: L-2-amino-thiazoline-4-carboxylic acid hydrolase [Bacillota bacterium]|jgi:hypothetical protein|nr:L-2-amino-thiazoline-4-carboxylic acid hydrolase [Bacillota bacterium]
MNFNEKHHAFISACFYKELMERCPGNGEATFVLATRRYGEQRGSRMAQRAIRDGRELDFAAYCAYGEWSYTEEHFLKGRHMEVVSKSPDYHYYVYECPWHDQYAEMNLIDGACIYCAHIDLSIARGFNPDLTFEVRSTLHKDGRCDFVLKDAYLEEKGYTVDKSKTQMPFEYHCGHIFKTFSDIVKSIHGEKGREICEKVAEEFGRAYGKDMAKVIISYEDVDFNVIP